MPCGGFPCGSVRVSAGGTLYEAVPGPEGFSVCVPEEAAAGGVRGLEQELFLDMRSFPPAHDSEVFRSLGARLLDEAAWYPFAVLDEIGGIDLIIPQFRVALDSLLASELPLLGVVKSREDSEQMRRLLGPGTRFTAFSERLFEKLSGDPETELLVIREDAESEAAAAVAAWAAEYADLPGFQKRL